MHNQSRFLGFSERLLDFIRIAEVTLSPKAVKAETQEHLDEVFQPLALELFQLQFEHNIAYRKFCTARQLTPEDIHDWRQIPAVPTSGFKDLELTCLPTSERTTVFHSSGTTEQRPSRHYHSLESLKFYETSLWSWFSLQVLSNSSVPPPLLLMLTPPPHRAPNSSLVYMFDTLQRRLGLSESVFLGNVSDTAAWTLDFDRACEQLREAASAARPVMLLGTAFSFVQLIDNFLERSVRFKMPPGSCAMETGGYKGRSRSVPKAELHRLIQSGLGIPTTRIVSEYGMSELSSQAYDLCLGHTLVKDRHFRFPPWCRVQIICPETAREAAQGTPGLIRVFDLSNVYSVMAIQTEDLGIQHDDGFELIGRIELAEPRGCSLRAVA